MDAPGVRARQGVPCPDCRGTGKVALLVSVKPCSRCGGTGQLDPVLDWPIPSEELSVRTRKLLNRMGVETLRQAARLSAGEVLATRGSTPTTVREIQQLLARYGLTMRK